MGATVRGQFHIRLSAVALLIWMTTGFGWTDSVVASVQASPALDDPSYTLTWQLRTPMPVPIGVHAAATGANGKIYIFGGFIYPNRIRTVRAYDPTTDSWSSAADMPAGRSSPVAVSA